MLSSAYVNTSPWSTHHLTADVSVNNVQAPLMRSGNLMRSNNWMSSILLRSRESSLLCQDTPNPLHHGSLPFAGGGRVFGRVRTDAAAERRKAGGEQNSNQEGAAEQHKDV